MMMWVPNKSLEVTTCTRCPIKKTEDILQRPVFRFYLSLMPCLNRSFSWLAHKLAQNYSEDTGIPRSLSCCVC
jgi:hypothetical protein